MCQRMRIMVVVMTTAANINPPAPAKDAELNHIVSPRNVDIGGKSFGLHLTEKELPRFDALSAKYPKVSQYLGDVVLSAEKVVDAYRKVVQEIHSSDMKHEDSSFLMRAWGWGKDRISMVHRIVDASPKVREAYLKGDFGFRKALTEARTEGELGGESGGEGSRGGKRTGQKKGGTKAQRDALYAQAEVVGKECKGWLKPGKLPIKSGPVRCGEWVISIVAAHRPMPVATPATGGK